MLSSLAFAPTTLPASPLALVTPNFKQVLVASVKRPLLRELPPLPEHSHATLPASDSLAHL